MGGGEERAGEGGDGAHRGDLRNDHRGDPAQRQRRATAMPGPWNWNNLQVPGAVSTVLGKGDTHRVRKYGAGKRCMSF
jgi:hypothetical protein